MSNGKVAEMTLSADELPRKKTPLKWYYVDKVNKRSKPTMEPYPKIAIIISLLVTGAIIGFVTCWLWFNVISTPIKTNTETNTETVTEEQTKGQEGITPTKSAISGREYLESHDVWKKSEMEEIPELKGLFDALNTYDQKKINQLCQGKEFGDRMEEIISTLTKIEGNLPNTSYCTDEKINFENYIKKLKKSIKSKYPETGTRDTSKIGNQGEL